MTNEVWDDLLTFGEDYLGEDRDWALSSAELTWIAVWRYGIIVDDTGFKSLGSYWNPNGDLVVQPDYYVPDDFDTEVPTIDSPNTEGVAWDARPVTS